MAQWPYDRITGTNRLYSQPSVVKPPRGDAIFYAPGVASRRLDENSTAVSVTNTTTETTLGTMTLPALTLGSTGAARFTVHGNMNIGASVDVTFRVKLNDGVTTSTIVATSAISMVGASGTRDWNVHGYILGTATDAQRTWTWVDVSEASTALTHPVEYNGVAGSTTSLNDAAAMTMTVTAQMSVASTQDTITQRAAILEGVN